MALGMLSLASCSILLDWSDYTGGTVDGAESSIASDAALADTDSTSDGTEADEGTPKRDGGSADRGAQDAGVGPSDVGEGAPPCDLSLCANCDITLEYQACCLPDGGCGCHMQIPLTACMPL